MKDLMKQAKQMAAKMEKMKDDLSDKKVEATAGGGMVTVEATGGQSISKITIDPEVVDPDDVEMLEDLVTAAVNEALRKSQDMVAGEMQKLTGGLPIPGM